MKTAHFTLPSSPGCSRLTPTMNLQNNNEIIITHAAQLDFFQSLPPQKNWDSSAQLLIHAYAVGLLLIFDQSHMLVINSEQS